MGWHGDLDAVPAGFATSLGIYEADTVTAALARWRRDLTAAIASRDRPRANPLLTHLSYWTDNGAAYWYRTEPGRTIAESAAEAVVELAESGVPVGAVELDSWFYPHAVERPITEVGYPVDVPPTGALDWTPRADAFPAEWSDPMGDFREAVGGRPLVLHARHIAPTSPLVTDGRRRGETWWVDEHAAHPVDPDFFRRWFDDAARWGACAIEQDWMQVVHRAVGALRERPGRTADWQRALDRHAAETGVDLLWCMATPADLVLAAELERVVAVRTCDDYRFAEDPAILWTWFLTVARLADALGLTVFKDCFFTNRDVDPSVDDPIDGDPHAEVEALLAALSGGPVGIGDRRGRTDTGIVRRVCDDDGRIRRVDRPLGLVDDCLFGSPARGERLAWATTTATDALGRVWRYVVALNTSDERVVVADRFDLGGDRVVYDWRRRASVTADRIEVELTPRDWLLAVVSPPGAPPAPDVGDPDRYVVVEAAP